MKLALLTIGGNKEPWLNELTDEYQRKISYFLPFEVIRLKPIKLERAANEAKQKAEAEALLKALGKDDLLIVCDERGKQLDSVQFSQRLVKSFEKGKPRVVVMIGGAFGVTDEIRKRADFVWSFSSMVMNHHIAQAVALEQLYRALTIWKNMPYHNA